MDLSLTQEQELMRKTIADFAEKEIRPYAREIDEKGTFPDEIIKKAAAFNLLGLSIPQAYGGVGVDTISFGLCLAEIGKVCMGTALTLVAHNALAANHIALFGTEEQKRKWLPSMANGTKLGAWALTEPSAGSDLLALGTSAVREKNGWRLNGSKCFITNGSKADVVIVMAVTPEGKDEKKKGKCISAFIIEPGTSGFEVGAIEDKVCARGADMAELFFNDCLVPKENLLGQMGEALPAIQECLATERIMIAAILTGGAEQAYSESLEYAKQRVQFGKPIAQFQSVYSTLVGMATNIEASKLLWYRAAQFRDAGQPYRREAAMAKLYATEIAQKITSEAVQVHGGLGLMKEYPVERYWRDALWGEFAGGTSNIQKLEIARDLGIKVEKTF
jgi:butyryl-CoA dehydrogenase